MSKAKFVFVATYFSSSEKRCYAVRAFMSRKEASEYVRYSNADWNGLGRVYYVDTIPLV